MRVQLRWLKERSRRQLAIGMTRAFGVSSTCAMLGAALGSSKGNGTAGFLLGLFLGPLGLILVLLLPEDGRRCHLCKGVVPQEAVKCKHCGSKLLAEVQVVEQRKSWTS
jgi:hypothetical protein